jgi:hypothetical protein
VEEFKDAIFMYEPAELPAELRVVDGIAQKFKEQPEAATTLVQVCHTLEEAAVTIDAFKAATCGSAYTLGVININMLKHVDDLKFLMRGDVMGDPRTVFVASLRYMVGDIYAFAKDKIGRESEDIQRPPSCIICYGANNREEAYANNAELCATYLREFEERAKAKRSGTFYLESKSEELLRKTGTAFYGKKLRRPSA